MHGVISPLHHIPSWLNWRQMLYFKVWFRIPLFHPGHQPVLRTLMTSLVGFLPSCFPTVACFSHTQYCHQTQSPKTVTEWLRFGLVIRRGQWNFLSVFLVVFPSNTRGLIMLVSYPVHIVESVARSPSAVAQRLRRLTKIMPSAMQTLQSEGTSTSPHANILRCGLATCFGHSPYLWKRSRRHVQSNLRSCDVDRVGLRNVGVFEPNFKKSLNLIKMYMLRFFGGMCVR
jgi:hypothetical protein